MMKKVWRSRVPPPSKSGGGYFVQHAVTLKSLQEQRHESSSSSTTDSDSSVSESSYKTSSQLSPPKQNYKFKYQKPPKYNPFHNNTDFLASSPKEDHLTGPGVAHTTHRRSETPRKTCASINVPELVKYFDGLEMSNGQILTGRTTTGKPSEPTSCQKRPDQNQTYDQGKKDNDRNVVRPPKLGPDSDHTYSRNPTTRDHLRPSKSEDSDKTFVNTNPRGRKDLFDDERFRNVCTSRRRRIDELKKRSGVVVEQHGAVGSREETPVSTRSENAGEGTLFTKTNRNIPMKKYTSVVGPMPPNYRPVVDIAPNEHFSTRNNEGRLQANQSVPNLRNRNPHESDPKSSNIAPQPTRVTGGTYFHPRDRGDQMECEQDPIPTGDRGDQMGPRYQQKDYRPTSAYLDDQAKYLRRRENGQYPFTSDPSGGLHNRPSTHIGPRKDCKGNPLTRPQPLTRNDQRNTDRQGDTNRQGTKKGQAQNQTYDLAASEDCSNSLCLSRKEKGEGPQCQGTDDTEASTRLSASRFSINQSQSSPSVLSIRIDINLSHPNLFLAGGGAKSLDLKKKKTEKENP